MSALTQEQLAAVLAARQWADIPDTPGAIRAWAKGEPINRRDA